MHLSWCIPEENLYFPLGQLATDMEKKNAGLLSSHTALN